MDWDPSAFEATYFGAIPFIVAQMVLSGIYLCQRCHRLGPGLVIGGTVALAALWFWIAFILVPAAIVVIALADLACDLCQAGPRSRNWRLTGHIMS